MKTILGSLFLLFELSSTLPDEITIISFNIEFYATPEVRDYLNRIYESETQKVDVLLLQEDMHFVEYEGSRVFSDIKGFSQISTCNYEVDEENGEIMQNSIYLRNELLKLYKASESLFLGKAFQGKDSNERCAALAFIGDESRNLGLSSVHLSGGRYDDAEFLEAPEKLEKVKENQLINTLQGLQDLNRKLDLKENVSFVIGADANSFDKNEVRKRQEDYAKEKLGLSGSTLESFISWQTVPDSICSNEDTLLRYTATTGSSTIYGGIVDHFWTNKSVKNVKLLEGDGFSCDKVKVRSDHNPLLFTISVNE